LYVAFLEHLIARWLFTQLSGNLQTQGDKRAMVRVANRLNRHCSRDVTAICQSGLLGRPSQRFVWLLHASTAGSQLRPHEVDHNRRPIVPRALLVSVQIDRARLLSIWSSRLRTTSAIFFLRANTLGEHPRHCSVAAVLKGSDEIPLFPLSRP